MPELDQALKEIQAIIVLKEDLGDRDSLMAAHYLRHQVSGLHRLAWSTMSGLGARVVLGRLSLDLLESTERG